MNYLVYVTRPVTLYTVVDLLNLIPCSNAIQLYLLRPSLVSFEMVRTVRGAVPVLLKW